MIRAHVDEAQLAEAWTASGGRSLTDPAVPVPARLVQGVLETIAELDRHGAELARDFAGSGLGVIAMKAAASGLPASGRISSGGATRLLETADGWVALSMPRNGDHDLVPAWLQIEGAVDDVWTVVTEEVRGRSCAVLVERAALLGLACTEVGEAAARTTPAIPLTGGSAPPFRLKDATVVNLASLWAGPLAATVLGRLGARVITVESTTRLDGGRAVPPFFAAVHEGHEFVTVDLGSASGVEVLRSLLLRADVVIEGSRPRAMSQLGINAMELVANGPRVWMSITAHGRRLPHGVRIGYGDDAAAAGGLVGWVDGGPVFIADAVADPITALTVASVANRLAATGGRWVVDVALSRVAAALAPQPNAAIPKRWAPKRSSVSRSM